MAMIVDAFVSKFTEMLLELAKEKVDTILGVKKQLQRLQEKFQLIQAVLSDAERRRIHDADVNHWLSNLRDIMYDADDIIDLCKIKAHHLLSSSSSSSSSCFATNTIINLPFRRKIGAKIAKLNRRLDEIAADKIMFSLEHASSSSVNVVTTQMDSRQTSPLSRSDVVGREIEDATNMLVESLVKTGGDHRLRVYAVVGLGGIGKTTLAQRVYNHPRMEGHFQKSLWVCVSQSYSEIELLKQMVRGAGGDCGQAQTKAELLPLLSLTLGGNRFFLVLDDVWNGDVWEDLLQTPLEHGRVDSRVLITTRNDFVAKSMRAVQTHHVRKMSSMDGLTLLNRSVFEDGVGEEMQDLHEIGMQLVEKCDGLPLAIKAIAGVLRTKEKSRTEWEKVSRSHAWSLTGELPEAVNRALYLSYEDLPSQLKQCFLYCSLFPEDCLFHSCDLVRWWIAEGFIIEQSGFLLEDVAEDCYNKLVSRNLLHLDPRFLVGNRCRMHDLTRLLAIRLSRDESYFINANWSTITNSPKLRRLSASRTAGFPVVLNAIENPQCLRTLIINECSEENIKDIIQRFRQLRVLDLTGSSIKSIPSSIENLKHLRYLDLDGTRVCKLPESIGSLTNLLFLNLSRCKALHTLPKGITQLYNLRCLGLQDTPLSHVPTGIGKLKHLNDLRGFIVGDNDNNLQSEQYEHGCKLEEILSLSQLRRLGISKLERAVSRGIFALKNKTFLKELILQCTPQESNTVHQLSTLSGIEQIYEELLPPPSLEVLSCNYLYGLKFPSWMSVLHNLTNLNLHYCSCKQLPPLGQLHQLKTLYIIGASGIVTIGPEFLGCDMNDGTQTSLSKLETLVFREMENWEEWSFDVEEVEGRSNPIVHLLPCLSFVEINDCPKLRALPKGFQNVNALKDLYIRAAGSLREIENLLYLEELIIINNQCLETISNLPALRKLRISNSCRMLSGVPNLESLQLLQLKDDSIECLPQCLIELIQQTSTKGTLKELHLKCREQLQEKCIEGGQYYPILSMIHEVTLTRYSS